MAQAETDGAFGADHKPDDEQRREILRNHRRPRDARNAHVQTGDEKQIQRDVHAAGDRKEDHRAAAVAHGAQDGRAEIINQVGRHADEINPKIQRGKLEDILRRAHQLQHRPAEEKAERHHGQAADDGKRHRRMHRTGYAALAARAVFLRHNHTCADRQTHKQIHKQVDERTRRTDSRHGLLAVKPPDDDRIRRIEKQLQQVHNHNRDGKNENPFQNGPGTHIEFATLLSQGIHPLLYRNSFYYSTNSGKGNPAISKFRFARKGNAVSTPNKHRHDLEKELIRWPGRRILKSRAKRVRKK